MRQLANVIFSLMCMVGVSAVATAGERAFMSGDVTLVNEPFEPVRAILAKPTYITKDPNLIPVKPYQPENLTLYQWAPVQLSPDTSRRRANPNAQARQHYDCLLEIVVREDGNIALVSKQGKDCNFRLSDWVGQ